MARLALQSAASSLLIVLIATLALTATTPPAQAVSSPRKIAPEQTETDIELRYKRDTEAYENAFNEFEKKAGLDQPFHYDLSSLAVYLQTQMHDGPSPLIQQLAAVYFSTLRDYEVPVAESTYGEVVRIVPPESALWNRAPDSIRFVSESLSSEAARKFLNDLISRNPDRLIQARALISLVKLASRQHDPAAYQTCYRQLASNFKDLKDLTLDIALLNPDNKTAIGKKAAAFTLPSVEGGKPFSNQSVSGSYYLLDFWATWCGPCMGERASLRRAYERFKGRNFTIVSISLDETPEAVKRFRQARWAMPWENLFLPGGQKSQTAKDYDVSWIGLPHLLLVGPDGTILAIRDQLGRETLQKTLAEYLQP